MTTDQILLLMIWLFIVIVGAGVIEMLKRIEKAIVENYQASLARAMTTMDVAVTNEKEKVVKPCVCGHPVLQHWSVVGEAGPFIQGGKCHHTDETGRPDCGCLLWKPKRGPWPGEVKV